MKKEKICTILVVALLLLVMQGCSPKIKSVNDGIQQ